MMEFYLAALVVVLLGLLMWLPLLRTRKKQNEMQVTSRGQLNLDLHRQRIDELLEHTPEHEHDGLRDEMERELLDALEGSRQQPIHHADASGRMQSRWLQWGMPVLLLTGVGLYASLGRPDLASYHAGLSADESAQVVNHEMDRQLADLRTKLASRPDDLDGWLLLARSLMMTGRFQEALPALEQAMRLDPANPDIRIGYADAWAEAHEGNLSGKPEALIAEVLQQHPGHQDALWLSGMLAVQQKRIADAVVQWRKLQAQLPVDGDDHFRIETYIAKIQGLPMPVPAHETAKAGPAGQDKPVAQLSIEVSVRLDDRLKARMRPEDTLFIFARAASGPPMPLAIVRRKAGDLPVSVRLDDTMAMAPGMDIRSFSPLVIGARVSRSGQAKASPGDLQGLSEPLKIKAGGHYEVVIRDEVKG
ncbi:MAG: c-type cytochrome biosis protein CcmI [Pseudomonadota bacterium]